MFVLSFFSYACFFSHLPTEIACNSCRSLQPSCIFLPFLLHSFYTQVYKGWKRVCMNGMEAKARDLQELHLVRQKALFHRDKGFTKQEERQTTFQLHLRRMILQHILHAGGEGRRRSRRKCMKEAIA